MTFAQPETVRPMAALSYKRRAGRSSTRFPAMALRFSSYTDRGAVTTKVCRLASRSRTAVFASSPCRGSAIGTPLPADASAEAQADAHACLLDALGIERAAIVGGSAGAPSAMQFALRHPDRTAALVLLVPAAYVPREGGAPPLLAPRGTRFLFDTALRMDFLFWAAISSRRERWSARSWQRRRTS